MPATTDCRSYPYPLDTDVIDVAGDISRLANAVDDDMCALQALLRPTGVGVVQGSSLINPDTNPLIVWGSEAYDTDNFHVAGSTDIIIPTGLMRVYACSLLMTTTGNVTANCLVRLIITAAGTSTPSIRQAVIPTGQSIGNTSYTGPLTPGTKVQASFWNAGAGAIFVGSTLEVVSVAAWA